MIMAPFSLMPTSSSEVKVNGANQCDYFASVRKIVIVRVLSVSIASIRIRSVAAKRLVGDRNFCATYY